MIARRVWLVALAMAGLLLVGGVRAAQVQAQSQDVGVIEGQVTNGTAGTGPAADLDVVAEKARETVDLDAADLNVEAACSIAARLRGEVCESCQ